MQSENILSNANLNISFNIDEISSLDTTQSEINFEFFKSHQNPIQKQIQAKHFNFDSDESTELYSFINEMNTTLKLTPEHNNDPEVNEILSIISKKSLSCEFSNKQSNYIKQISLGGRVLVQNKSDTNKSNKPIPVRVNKPVLC